MFAMQGTVMKRRNRGAIKRQTSGMSEDSYLDALNKCSEFQPKLGAEGDRNICVSVIHVCVYVGMCRGIWKPKVNSRYLSSDSLHFIF